LDLSEDALQAAEKGLKRLREAYAKIDRLPEARTSSWDVDAWTDSLYEAMNDDFNTPVAIARLFEGAKTIGQIEQGQQSLTQTDKEKLKRVFSTFMFDILGLPEEQSEGQCSHNLEHVLRILIDLRNQARKNKNWELADRIRDELAAIGIRLKDGKDGTTWEID
jgi:cysteinyl-tRNA synthetase